MIVSGLEKRNDDSSSEAKRNERRRTYAFQRGIESQSDCNKAEKFYEIVNPLLKEQWNKWQRETLEVRKHLTEEKGCHVYRWAVVEWMFLSF